jgi:hypothetical protein
MQHKQCCSMDCEEHLPTAARRYAWAPYPPDQRYPFMCEKPQSLYNCSTADAPPTTAPPACKDLMYPPDTLLPQQIQARWLSVYHTAYWLAV